MPSLIDRLLGREEPVAAKAVVGPGAVSMEINPPLRSLRSSAQGMAKQALDLYHASEWINLAEGLVDDKFASVRWHLQDANGDTVAPDDPDPDRQDVLRFLRKPNPSWPRSRFLGLTARHQGLPGRAFWYLDQINLRTGIPLAAYIIHPGRMWAATDKAGNLIGWVMDADRPDGREPVPFTLDEIIQFPLELPDSGYYGVGKAQAAWRKALLTQHTDEYAAGIFASGGRIPGLIFPSNGVTFSNDEDFIAWTRAIKDSTDGSRRMSALRAAVDYVRTADAPNSLELPDLSMMSRDDTLALWRVPKSQVGMEAKTGLNGGERNKYDEAALWQNAIEPRLVTFVELLQARMLDRLNLTLVLETPNFDDDIPLYEIAEKGRFAPQTVDEKRAGLGLDPLDEALYGDLGTRIFMDSRLVQVYPEVPKPEPVPFGTPDFGARTDSEELVETDVSAKAKLHFEQIRARVEKKYTPQLQRAIADALSAQRAELAAKVSEKAEHIKVKLNDVTVWWNEAAEYQRLQNAIEPVLLAAARDVTQAQSATFFRPAKADSIIDRVLDYVRTKAAVRIRTINETTRDTLRKLIAQGITEGQSPAQLGDLIESSAAFDEYRSELIARTETMLAYNDASIGTYSNFGVDEVQALDGDTDAECAARNGAVYSISEASGITDHPNGTLDWVPIVKARDPMEELAEAIKALTEKETPAPVVNVPAPVVNVNPPPVVIPEIRMPEIKLPAAKAALPAEVRVVSMPNRVHTVIRRNGEVVGSSEEDDA